LSLGNKKKIRKYGRNKKMYKINQKWRKEKGKKN